MFDLYKEQMGTEDKKRKYVPLDFKYDIDKRETVLRYGSPILVEGIEAVKSWIYKTLMTKRGFYTAYSFQHGQDYDELIGSPLSYEALKEEARRYTKEAVLVHKSIIDVEDFKFEIFEDSMKISFVALTTYGAIDMEVGI